MYRWIVPAFAVLCLLHAASAAGDAPTVAVGWNRGDPVLGDFDGDGRPDLVVAGPYEGAIQIMLADGDGTFRAPRSFTAGSIYTTAILAGDLDGDADLDLVTVHLDFYYGVGGELNVLLGHGDGTFDAPRSVTLPPVVSPDFGESVQQLRAAALGDLDGDGTLDLVAGGYTVYSDGEWGRLDGYMTVLPGNGDGTFGPGIAQHLGENWEIQSLATADYDGDGRVDVVSGGWMPDAWGFAVRLGNGDGTLRSPRETYPGGAALSGFTTPTPVWDLDRDGKIDLLMAGYGGNVFLRGNGDGTFDYGESATFGVGSHVHTTLVGDVNADGIPDVVGVRGSTEYRIEFVGYDEYENPLYEYYDVVTTRSASVLLGYGNGTFDLTASWDLGTVDGWDRFYAPILADLDGDGLPDLASCIPGNVTFARNPGNWPPPSPSIRIDDATVTEGDSGTSPIAFTVRLLVPHGQEIGVDWSTSADSAALGGDVVAASGTVRFAPGETSQTILVQVVGDLVYEALEGFTVDLAHPTPNATIADGRGYGTIVDDDPHSEISIDDVTVTEGDEGTTPAVFTVRLSAPYPDEVTVDYTTYSGTAVLGTDLVATSGTVRFAPGEVSRTVVVEVVGERLHEAAEYFWVALYSPTPTPNVSVAYYLGYGTILDDDPRPDVRIDDVARPEGQTGGTPFQFPVTLSFAYPEQVTVYYRTVDGTATSGTKKRSHGDYAATSGSLVFSPGTTTKTISVQVRGDREVEADETFYVEIYYVQKASIADGSGLATVLNDD